MKDEIDRHVSAYRVEVSGLKGDRSGIRMRKERAKIRTFLRYAFLISSERGLSVRACARSSVPHSVPPVAVEDTPRTS